MKGLKKRVPRSTNNVPNCKLKRHTRPVKCFSCSERFCSNTMASTKGLLAQLLYESWHSLKPLRPEPSSPASRSPSLFVQHRRVTLRKPALDLVLRAGARYFSHQATLSCLVLLSLARSLELVRLAIAGRAFKISIGKVRGWLQTKSHSHDPRTCQQAFARQRFRWMESARHR